MGFHHDRYRTRIKRKAFQYWKCGAKTMTFLFWATIHLLVMRLTIFKKEVATPAVEDPSILPDNYTKWMNPVVADDIELDPSKIDWSEPENKTIVEIEERVKRVQNVCRSGEVPVHSINSKEFFIDAEHNLVYCNIFKAASTFWLSKLNLLAGYKKQSLIRTRHNPLTLARRKFPRPSEQDVEEAVNTPGVVSLLVVREPFVRLLSAYRDKLENKGPLYYLKLARFIVAKYRNKALMRFGHIKTLGPTFYEFVSYLIDTNSKSDQPVTFDEHWAPYYQFCSPCAVNFSVIAKVETLTQDAAYVIHELGLTGLIGLPIGGKQTMRSVMNRSRDGRNTSALIRSYFSQLDKDMIKKLLNIYGVDFKMFGYDPTVYKQYATN